MANRKKSLEGSARVTILDVARAAGVTDGTVSRALAGDSRVKGSTREKILEAASHLGYRPHAGARSLRRGRSNALAVFCEGGHWIFHNNYFGTLIAGLAEAAEEDGVHLVFYLPKLDSSRGRTPYDWPMALGGLEELRDGSVDGGVIVGGRAVPPGDLKKLQATGLPLVLMSPDKPLEGLFQLEAAVGPRVRLAAEALLEQGHHRIGMVGLHRDRNYNILARKELKEAMEREGRLLDPLLIEEPTDWSVNEPKEMEAALERLLKHGATAVICSDVRQAAVLLDLAQARGLEIPRDLSMVSFGPRPDEIKARVPQLSLVEADLVEAGRECYRLFQQAMVGKKPEIREIPWAWVQKGQTLARPAKK